MPRKQCKDPRLTFLNELGFNVIKLPRGGIAPLDVLGADKDSIERLGTLSQIWSSDAELPPTKPSQTAVQINGAKTKSLKLSVGLSILSSILEGMGAALPQLKFAYRRARKVEFSFSNVRTSAVDPFAAGRFLTSGDLDTDNPFVARYFQDETTRAFLMTEVLESDTIKVTALDDRERGLELDVPSIQNAVGAKVSVETAGSSNTEISYKGAEFLAFGFKVFGIAFVDGDWEVEGVPASGELAFQPEALRPTVFSGSLLSVGDVKIV